MDDKDLEETFAAIMQSALSEAEEIDCELSEYLEGLKAMRAVLGAKIEQVSEEVGE